MAKILLLGAYGLIGTGVAQALSAAGHDVVAFGRSARAAGKLGASYDWVIGDMRDHLDADSWQPLLEGVDAVVNAAGALQDGPDDDLEVVHHFAIRALAQACEEAGVSLIQISASGAELTANTEFMRSKARGDAAIVASGCKHVILRPGLVLAATAYGGTLLLRQLAAVPWVQPVALGKTQVQTVSLPDVARAVLACVEEQVPEGAYDLVEEAPHKLRDVLGHMRSWLGFKPARLTLPLPKPLLWPVAKLADGLGQLGWRSPLRSTAVATLKGGVVGDATAWNATGVAPMGGLQATLANMPARAEDRLAARMALLMPLVVAVLSAFWLVSGFVGLWKLPVAAEVLTQAGWAQPLALASVGFFALVDVALGLLVLVRKHAGKALWGMIGVSLFYLLSASVVTPALWLDPLGPLVKVLPSIALAAGGHTHAGNALMEYVDALRWLHVIGACVLLGTGAGIAFFMLMAHRTGQAALVAHTAGVVVIADTVFTATAAIVQPITGVLLALETGWPLSEGWIVLSLALYAFTGVFWLPVVWIQLRMRDLAHAAAAAGEALPAQYHRLFKIWFACGFPAFFAVVGIVWLMLVRPAIGLF